MKVTKLICDSGPATRLLRALHADIKVYNSERIAAGEDLTLELAEARAKFESRVIPPLYPLFDEVIQLRAATRIIKEQRPKRSRSATPAQPSGPFETYAEPSGPRPRLTLGERLTIGTGLLLMIVGAATSWLLNW